MMMKHVISVSGGKDSTALLLLAIDQCPRESILPVFCDTGNEHEAVYEYLGYLEQVLDIKIHRLKADFSEQITAKRLFISRDQRVSRDKQGRKRRWTNKAKRRALEILYPTGNPFLDLCLWKGRFPSRRAQFCTEELKRNIAVAFQLDLIDQGYRVLSWQGIRRDESPARKNAKKTERLAPGLWAFRPLVDWTAEDVFCFHKASNIEPNPLYKQGMTRVGCMPCINCGKDELREIAARFPEHIERISEWERLVSQSCKRGFSTFFHKLDESDGATSKEIFERNHIQQIVEWSKTSRGGKQYDLLAFAQSDEPLACASAYGLCE